MRPTTSPALRRMLLSMTIAASLAFSLAACGSDDDPIGEPVASVDGSVPGTTVPGMRAPVPVEVATGSTGANTAVAGRESTEMASADMATSDMSMIAPYYISEFVLGDGFPALPTNDVGFVFDGVATPTDDEIMSLAAVFGVEGDIVATDQDGYKSWQVGPNDGTSPTIYVSGDAQLSWSFSPAWDDSANSSASCVSVDPAVAMSEPSPGSVVEEPAVEDDVPATTAVVPTGRPAEVTCDEPEAPANVPTADEAQALAIESLTALGVDSANLTFDNYSDQWSASVSATVTRDGTPTGQTYSFGYGAEGALVWAGGSLATPSPVGPYDLVDIDTALARLVEMNAWQGGTARTDMLAIDTAEAPAGDVGTAGDGVGGGVAGSEGATDTTAPETKPIDPTVEPMPVDTLVDPMPVESVPVEIMPVETYPAPEARTVTLVDVQADVWWAWDVNNVLWLLPAYRFIDSEGGWHVAPAVTDEFLIEVEPPVLETTPAEPPSDPIEEVEPGVPADFDATALDDFVGAPLDEFTKQAETLGLSVRVTESDGESLPSTDDYRPDRVNVAVTTDDGVETVTAVISLG